MAASAVQIAKLALSYLGDRFDITDLDEETPEARQVKLVFDDARDALLREHPWNFAKFYYCPTALSGTPPAQWTYMYAFPPEGLRVFRIVNPNDPRGDTAPFIPFDTALNSEGSKVLLTDQGSPEFECVKKVTDVGAFDTQFDLALSWRVAQMVAIALTGSEELLRLVAQQGDYWVSVAKRENSSEGYTPQQDAIDPDWLRKRG